MIGFIDFLNIFKKKNDPANPFVLTKEEELFLKMERAKKEWENEAQKSLTKERKKHNLK